MMPMTFRDSPILLIILAGLACTPSAFAQTDLFVSASSGDDMDGDNDCISLTSPCLTIHHAYSQTSSGDRIFVLQGTYTMDMLTVSGRELTLIGVGENPPIIQAHPDGPEQASSRLFWVLSGADLTIENLWLRHGNADNGGAIDVLSSTLTLKSSRISDNIANRGGGIGTSGDVTLTVDDSEISGNYANVSGGGIRSTAGNLFIINNSRIINNESVQHGAGISAGSSSQLFVTDSVVAGNHAGGVGGGIGATEIGVSGGPPVEISNSEIRDNSAGGNGGGIWSRGTLSITNGSLIDGNESGDFGGGIYKVGDPLVISDSIVSNNFSVRLGAGARVVGVSANPLIERSLFVGNESEEGGGGIAMTGNVTLSELINSTFSGNRAPTGAAIYFPPFADNEIVLLNNTITDNQAPPVQAAISLPIGDDAELTLANNILAGQRGQTTNCHLAVISSDGSNVSDDESCGFFVGSTDFLVEDAGLLPLTDNNGFSMTHAIYPDSPARGNGDFSICTGQLVLAQDQRQQPRSNPNGCDIGALETINVPVQIGTLNLPNGVEDIYYEQQIRAAGGDENYFFWRSSGALPDGLSLNGSTGVIEGLPTQLGSFEFTIQVSADGGSDSRDYVLNITEFDDLFFDRFESHSD